LSNLWHPLLRGVVFISRRKESILNFSFFILLCLSQAAQAQGGDPLTLGMQQFKSGNYAGAKPQLELAARQHPKSAQLQYILGNTYFQLGNKAQAQQAYETCLSLNPDATVSSYCKKMLSHLKPAAGAGSFRPGAAGSGSEHGGESSDPAQSKVEARRKEILHRAEEECAKVRKETQAQIAEAEANGNRWVRSVEKNDVHPTISKEDRAAIESESDQKISRIMDDAKRHANSISSP
jgi:tetratricopeptide (TPR) repeat protein